MSGIRIHPLNRLTARSLDSDESILVVSEEASAADAITVREAIGAVYGDGTGITDPQAFRVALGLDDGEGNFPVSAIVLSDAGSVARAADSLTYDGDGNIVKHDGLADGDECEKLYFSQKVQSITKWTTAENTMGTQKQVGRFFLPASKATILREILITGNIFFNHANEGGGTDVPICYVTLAPELDPPTAALYQGYGFTNDAASDWQLFQFFSLRPLLQYDFGDEYRIDVGTNTHTGLSTYAGAASATMNAGTVQPANVSETGRGPLWVGHWIGVYVYNDATATPRASYVHLDLEITFP